MRDQGWSVADHVNTHDANLKHIPHTDVRKEKHTVGVWACVGGGSSVCGKTDDVWYTVSPQQFHQLNKCSCAEVNGFIGTGNR